MKKNRFNDIYELLQSHNAVFRSKADLLRKIGIIEVFANSATNDTVEKQLIYVDKLLNVFGVHTANARIEDNNSDYGITRIGKEREEIIQEHLEWEEIKRQELFLKDLKTKILMRNNC